MEVCILAMQTITVPAGQRVNLDLPDGSNVWLNAGTTMQYPVSFMTDKREVILDGEAYFEVAHNEKSPFVVHTSTLDVEVLGTKFNVEAYSARKIFETSLMEGRVKVKLPHDRKRIPSFLATQSRKRTLIDGRVGGEVKLMIIMYIVGKRGYIVSEINLLLIL